MPVEVDLLLEGEVGVRREEAELRLGLPALALGAQLLHERERIDGLLDVDRDRGDREVMAVLLVLALPDELRIEVRVPGVAHDRGPLLLGAGERLELGGRDVGTGVAGVRGGPDHDLFRLDLVSHRSSPA